MRARRTMCLAGASTIAGYLLLAEHGAHIIAYLPWILLAAGPLMHLFMHHGHGGRSRPASEPGAPETPFLPRDEIRND